MRSHHRTHHGNDFGPRASQSLACTGAVNGLSAPCNIIWPDPHIPASTPLPPFLFLLSLCRLCGSVCIRYISFCKLGWLWISASFFALCSLSKPSNKRSNSGDLDFPVWAAVGAVQQRNARDSDPAATKVTNALRAENARRPGTTRSSKHLWCDFNLLPPVGHPLQYC